MEKGGKMQHELPKELENLFSEMQKVFTDKRHFTTRQAKALERLGIDVYGYTHPKITIGKQVITLSSSASDVNTHRQILRRIRKTLISEYKKGNIKI